MNNEFLIEIVYVSQYFEYDKMYTILHIHILKLKHFLKYLVFVYT